MNYTVSTIEKIDERFNYEKVNYYKKSIQLALNGFSYIVTNPDTKQHIAIRDYQFGLNVSLEKLEEIFTDLFTNEDILSAQHEQINLSFINRAWAVVPEMLFIEEKIPKLFNVNFKKNEFTQCIYSKVPGTELIFVSRIPKTWHHFFSHQATTVNFIPHQAAFAYNAQRTLKNNNIPNGFFINVNEHFFDLLFIENYTIKFYNNFIYKQYSDILYFILSACKKLEANVSESHIFLQGNELVKEILPTELNRHIKYIYVDKELYEEHYSAEFEQLPLYQYKLLTGIFSCTL